MNKPTKILSEMARKLRLQYATLDKMYEDAKKTADKKFYPDDFRYSTFIMDIVKNRANARAALCGRNRSLACRENI